MTTAKEYLYELGSIAKLGEDETLRRQVVSRIFGIAGVHKMAMKDAIVSLEIMANNTNSLNDDLLKYVIAFKLITSPNPLVQSVVKGNKLVDIFENQIVKKVNKWKIDENVLTNFYHMEGITGYTSSMHIEAIRLSSSANITNFLQLGGAAYGALAGYIHFSNSNTEFAAGYFVISVLVGINAISGIWTNCFKNKNYEIKKNRNAVNDFQKIVEKYITEPLAYYDSKG